MTKATSPYKLCIGNPRKSWHFSSFILAIPGYSKLHLARENLAVDVLRWTILYHFRVSQPGSFEMKTDTCTKVTREELLSSQRFPCPNKIKTLNFDCGYDGSLPQSAPTLLGLVFAHILTVFLIRFICWPFHGALNCLWLTWHPTTPNVYLLY